MLTLISLANATPPNYNANLIDRDCLGLLKRNLTANKKKIVTIEASAGTGKSTLLMQFYRFLESQNLAVAWLSLSSREQEPVVILSGVATALQAKTPGVGMAVMSLLQAGISVSLHTALTTLFNEIFAYGKEITLFLDDLHLCKSSATQKFIQELIDESPENLTLIAAGRDLAYLNLAKLTTQGLHYGLKNEDLRASEQDAQAFFNKEGNDKIDEREVNFLLNVTDGWINAMQMVSISLDQNTDSSSLLQELEDNHHNISAYLEHEIYSTLSAEIQHFLCCTSGLDYFSAEVCDYVLSIKNSTQIIQQLRKMNLFIIQLDESGKLYRYHHLFSDFLRKQANLLDPELRRQIKLRAYDWFYENQLFSEAVEHALFCQEWERALEALLACREELTISNRVETLMRWKSLIPKALQEEKPITKLIDAWQLAFIREHHVSASLVDQVKQYMANQAFEPAQKINLEKEIAALSGVIASNRGNLSEIQLITTQASAFAPDRQNIWDSAYTTVLVYAYVFMGKLDKAKRVGVEQLLLDDNNNLLASVYGCVCLGWSYRESANFKQAQVEYAKASSVANTTLTQKLQTYTVTRALNAEILYHFNKVDEAWDYSPSLDALIEESSTIEPVIVACIIKSRLHLLKGEFSEGLEILAKGEAVGKSEASNRIVTAILAERVRVLLELNQLNAAEDIANELFDAFKRDPNNVANQLILAKKPQWLENFALRDVTIVRIELYKNIIDKSPELLDALIELATKESRNFSLIGLFLLKAHLLELQSKEKEADTAISKALNLASFDGLVRPFLDAGDVCISRIKKIIQIPIINSPSENATQKTELYAKLETALHIPNSNKELKDDLNESNAVSALKDVKLSKREQQLMFHLNRGLKNTEIAEQLFISPNTVAWHLRNLYEKLGVSNRTSAVAMARKLGD